MRAAVLALGLAMTFGASAVCVEVNEASRSELLTPSAAEAFEDCLVPSVRAEASSNTWRFIQVQRGGRGGGGYRGGYSAYRPPPSSSMARSFNRAAAPRPPVVRPPAARPPIARAPSVRLGPSVSRMAPRTFARAVTPRQGVSATAIRGVRALGTSVRAPGRSLARGSTPRVATRPVGAARPAAAITRRVATARSAVPRRGGGSTQFNGSRLAAPGTGASLRVAFAGVARGSGRYSGVSGNRTSVEPRLGFAGAVGRGVLVVRTPNMLSGATSKSAVGQLRSNPNVRFAEAALRKQMKGLAPANQNLDARARPISGQMLVDPRMVYQLQRTPKLFRPSPDTYLSKSQLADHKQAFDQGAVRFRLKSDYDKHGVGSRDGTAFVMTKSEANRILSSTRGSPRLLEQALGLNPGALKRDRLVRIDVDKPRSHGIRVPSGNEAGANRQWIPGGLLPSGAREGVVNAKGLRRDVDYRYRELDVD